MSLEHPLPVGRPGPEATVGAWPDGWARAFAVPMSLLWRARNAVAGGLAGAFLGAVLVVSPHHSAAQMTITESQLQTLASRYGTQVRALAENWQRLIADYRGAADMEMLKAANNFFNQLAFLDDIVHWGKEDYWATPLEFMGTGAGDCEDFSIAKYFSLLEMGMPESKLRITYVKALELNQAHMVLAYYSSPNAEPLILDNLKFHIARASERPDLKPVYSFNGEGLWLSVARGQGKRVGDSGQIKHWQSLATRMQREQS